MRCRGARFRERELKNKKLHRCAFLVRPTGIAAMLGAGLLGCAVGPNFHSPQAPPTPADHPYTSSAPPAQTLLADGVAQQLLPGQDIPALWWSLFHSPALDQLIRGALANSPSLASAQAALRQAQENYRAQSGALRLPSVSAQLGATRKRATSQEVPPDGGVFNLYNASVSVAYMPDVFGGTRRALESSLAQVDFQRFQLEAAYLALTANLVTTAIREASLRAQLRATLEVLDAQQKQLDLIDRQFQFGAIARTTVLSERNQVAQTVASLPPLEKALAQTRHQLSVYAGKLPSEPGMPEFRLDSLQLPQQLPISLPSALVRQRPDIRASEALLHQASAQVGVASANLYPQFSLSGAYGASSTTVGKLFSSDTLVWSLAASLTQPIFNGGSLSAKRRAAVAAYDQAAADYRATLLSAFQNVADSLRALEFDAAALKAQTDVDALAGEALALVTRQYQLGAVSYLTLLDAQRTQQQARIGLVQAQAARFADTAALFQALGGGWWNRPAPPTIDRQPSGG